MIRNNRSNTNGVIRTDPNWNEKSIETQREEIIVQYNKLNDLQKQMVDREIRENVNGVFQKHSYLKFAEIIGLYK